jgi:hypothetical protein
VLLLGCEISDAGAAALEGGLHGHLDDKRHCGGDGSFLQAMRVARGWRRGFLVLAALRHGQRPDRVLEARLGDRSWPEVPSVVKVFLGESSAL